MELLRETVGMLSRLAFEVTEGRVMLDPKDLSKDLNEQGLDSLALLNLLVAIEDRTGIEWSPDTPWETFTTSRRLAEFLIEHYGAEVDALMVEV